MTFDLATFRQEASDALDILSDLKYVAGTLDRDDVSLDKNVQRAIDAVNAVIDELDKIRQEEG